MVALLVAVVVNAGSSSGSGSSSFPHTSSASNTNPAPTHTEPTETEPTDPEPTETETDTDERARAQAQAIDELLSESALSRSEVISAYTALERCDDGMEDALETMNDQAEERGAQLDTARGLEVDALEDGATLQEHLIAFLEASKSADEAYYEAGRSYGMDCYGELADRDETQSGHQYSETAVSEKTAFLEFWNPVAATYGLTERSSEEV
ncbi:hypothetical protein [Microbispora sp. H11081]|uniref:hypothetical protein n=1 Tax=Microbispora sp. H11081 TaxID=2729107 RepID=UPI00147277F6|nr:hypothetical protein [Microbispora sp. H11081]